MEAKRCWTHSPISAVAASVWPPTWKASRSRCKGRARPPSSCDWRPGGPARQGRGAFVAREDVAQTAAAAMRQRPGGIYDVTGPEALSVGDIAGRLSALVGRHLRYEDESADAARDRR